MTTTTNNEIAKTTWSQIPVMTKMACGMRNPTAIGSKLTIKVGGRMRWVEITLTADDLYLVELVRITRDHRRVVVESHDGIFNDMLGDVLYRACNK